MSDDNRTKLQAILGDKYDVQDMIYRGGMGEIYLGLHKTLGTKVAIKIMIQRLTDDPELKKRFHREAQLYANLRHPNIIHIYDFGTAEAFDYMVFPFIEGETLYQKLQREGRIDVKECLHIIISVAKALAYASENNVIHRDVKPSNIMIEKNGNVLIADFGISKNLKDIELTLPGTVLGSPKYISPEQVLAGEADSRSDQYALGIIFFEMITGNYPFQGTQASALFYSHVNEIPQIPEKIVPLIQPEIINIINKLIAKDPASRFDDFNSLIDELTIIQMEETQIHRKDGHHHTRSGKNSSKPMFYFKSALLITGIAILLVLEYFWLDMRQTEKIGAHSVANNVQKPVPAANSMQIENQTAETQITPVKAETMTTDTEITASQNQDKPMASLLSVSEIKKLLLNFGEPDRSGLFQIGINQKTFQIGETIAYSIEAVKDCHVILLNFTTNNEIIQLFPNRFHPESGIQAGSVYSIPSQGSFDVTGPAGLETVVGFAGETALDLLPLAFDQSPFVTVTDANPENLEQMILKMRGKNPDHFYRRTIDFQISNE